MGQSSPLAPWGADPPKGVLLNPAMCGETQGGIYHGQPNLSQANPAAVMQTRAKHSWMRHPGTQNWMRHPGTQNWGPSKSVTQPAKGLHGYTALIFFMLKKIPRNKIRIAELLEPTHEQIILMFFFFFSADRSFLGAPQSPLFEVGQIQ